MTNEECEEKLQAGKIGLMLRAPFFGNLASRLKIVNADSWCATAATDGRHLFYNSDFISKLSSKNIEFLFGHEILHIALGHFDRCGSRDRKIANIAQDYAANQILIDEKVGEVITVIKLCINPNYKGWAWEDIYDDLIRNDGNNKSDDDDDDMVCLDDHINADRNDDKAISENELQRIRDEFKAAMIQAAAAAGDRTPKAISRLLDELYNPKMSWKELLRLNLQSLVKNNYSYSRPNKKGFGGGFTLPGLVREEAVEVCIALDMSGSIGQNDATAFLSEVVGIVEQYTEFKIDLWCFDTDIHNFQTFTSENMLDLFDYEPAGGGGTNFVLNYEFMNATYETPPKMFIMFTDGEPWGDWGDPDYCETIFVIKGNPIDAPFGQTITYDDI